MSDLKYLKYKNKYLKSKQCGGEGYSLWLLINRDADRDSHKGFVISAKTEDDARECANREARHDNDNIDDNGTCVNIWLSDSEKTSCKKIGISDKQDGAEPTIVLASYF